MFDGARPHISIYVVIADPELPDVAGVAARPLLLPQLVVADQLERLVEERLEVPRVDRKPADEGRRFIEGGMKVDPPHVGRVLADLPRQRIHRALDDVRRLRPAGAAVRVGRRRVRDHAPELVPVRLRVVGTHIHPRAELGDAGREQLVVRAHVRQLDELHADQLPVLVGGERHVVQDAASVDRRDVVLTALLDPLHRHAELLRQPERERLLGVDVQLRAEARRRRPARPRGASARRSRSRPRA